MKSVILCEGPDDLWFIAYYLHKTAGWQRINDSQIKRYWKYYQINPLDDHQQVQSLYKGDNLVGIWCVGGKSRFSECLKIVLEKYVKEIPAQAIDSIVIMRDRDDEAIETILCAIERALPGISRLTNQQKTVFSVSCNGETAKTAVTPVILPFDEQGAIETLLINAVQEQSSEGEQVVQSAKQYVDGLAGQNGVREKYLPHDRLLLKAKYSAVIAITNPDHSTGLFQNMVMNCPWEKSDYVKKHFDIIFKAITQSDDT